MVPFSRLFALLVYCTLVGCHSMQVPLGGRESEGGLCISETDVSFMLQSLRVGMCENQVFEILTVSHDTPNLYDLDTTTVYEHLSLLQTRPEVTTFCDSIHNTEVPFVGHRIPCVRLRRSAYLKGLQWVQRTKGEDSYVDLLFYRGAFVSYAIGGVQNKDSKDSAYPWEAVLGNPYREAGGTLTK